MKLLEDAGTVLKKVIRNVNFDLDNSFCDAEALKSSWPKSSMPDEWLSFYSALHRIPKPKLLKSANCVENDFDEFEVEENTNFPRKDDKPSPDLCNARNKAFCDLQILYNRIYQGHRKVPLCEMLSHSLYHKTRSKQILTTLNKIGITYSYFEVRRSRALKVQLNVDSSKEFGIPFPSNFDKKSWTFGALDNEDYSDNSSIAGEILLNVYFPLKWMAL